MSSDGIMDYPDYKYVSLITYNVRKFRLVVDTSLINEPYKLSDCYKSWCRFNDDIRKYQKAHNKSLQGYDGLCYSDFLPIDIDNKEKPERSLYSCRDLLQFLEQTYDVPIEAIRIYFSGSKGFHLEIPTVLFGNIKPSTNLPTIYKTIVISFGFNDIDTSIYHLNGLWRLFNSVNSKSGLYKIPLTYADINTLTYEQICHKAKVPNKTVIWTPFNDWNGIESLQLLWKQSIPAVSEKLTVPKNSVSNKKSKIDFPGVVEGKRNNTAFEIAMQLKVRGYTLNEVNEYIVKVWNPKNIPPESNIRSLYRTVESAFGYNHYDSGSIEITKHLRTDPYYNVMDSEQKAVYIYFISHINEVEKMVWGKYPCKPNQCIFSYGSVANRLNVGIQRVKTLIKYLDNKGRLSVETLYKDGKAACSRITFHNINLTQYLTHQNDLSKNCDKLTHQLTTTNIIKEREMESSL